MQATKSQIKKLQPFLVGEDPGEDGEWGMFCPLHDDANRSASLNIDSGVWVCLAGCGGGTLSQLVDAEDTWVPPEGRVSVNGSSAKRRSTGRPERVSEGQVGGWTAALLDDRDESLSCLEESRGITAETAREFELGWDQGKSVYTIPVRGPKGQLWNVRRYDPDPREDARKIWSIRGMGSPRLYPFRQLKHDGPVIICEGEWDTLLTIQNDFNAVTRTGAADVWKQEWNSIFEGRVVYLCHDRDLKGERANKVVANALEDVAAEIRVLNLPYPVTDKHGKDLTDFWFDNPELGPIELAAIIEDAQVWNDERGQPESVDPSDASVLDTFDARRVAKPLRLTVTIKGKREPGYSLPRHVKFSCTQDAGAKCQLCPLYAHDGQDEMEIEAADPVVLELMEAPSKGVHEILRAHRDIQKCTRMKMTVKGHQSVEVLYARPSVDHTRGQGHGDYKNMKITSVGRHDTLPNNTVQAVGALHPDPRRQSNEFLAWSVAPMETSLDTFTIDDKVIESMKMFQAHRGQNPLSKLGAISRSLASHVTKIYGRPEMHALMDLTFHSVLSFNFMGRQESRGWLDVLVQGDTRTGKSEAAEKLIRHYRAGEMISCESATFAGIIGGLQQYGSGKEWSVSWGAVPINDRRLVILDEVGGLHPDEIARMSSVRSSGTAELTKIQSERTYARTRLIWLANPRNGRMADYTYGVQAIRPLIGNDEDIARFDVAMSVTADEVPISEINRQHEQKEEEYDSDSCAALLKWAWSRKPEDVVWGVGAEAAVLQAANSMGRRYTESPPLVQGANIRVKIARVAVALAARLFSTDATYEQVVVGKEHVSGAVQFLDRIYGMKSFGYAERSSEVIFDRREAEDNRLKAEHYLETHENLSKFLRGNGKFRRQDLEEIMNISREEANAIINKLWGWRLVRKDRSDVRVEPTLHSILRSIK